MSKPFALYLVVAACMTAMSIPIAATQAQELSGSPGLVDAEAAIDACLAHRRDGKLPPLAVAVVDGRGQLVALKREDGALPVTAEVAILKARTAQRTGLPSSAFRSGSEADATLRDTLLQLQLTAMPGGVPLPRASGGVGVSGATPEDDEACALRAVARDG